MSDGEKMVWAAAFVAMSLTGKYPQEAATSAAMAVMSMRQARFMDSMPCLGIPPNEFVKELLDVMMPTIPTKDA